MPQLATYELKPYFYLERPSQGVVFSAPAQGGATTPNSQNPRSELRQMINGENAAWSNKSQTWTMQATMCFQQIPTSSDATRGVVGLQIHDGNDDVTVLRLEKNGDLWVTKGDETHHDLVNGSYVLGTFMNVKVVARKGGGILWYINNMTTPVASVPGVISGAYFKAGAYTQTGPGATGQGVTIFRSLKVSKT
jgi:hypothetical protein